MFIQSNKLNHQRSSFTKTLAAITLPTFSVLSAKIQAVLVGVGPFLSRSHFSPLTLDDMFSCWRAVWTYCLIIHQKNKWIHCSLVPQLTSISNECPPHSISNKTFRNTKRSTKTKIKFTLLPPKSWESCGPTASVALRGHRINSKLIYAVPKINLIQKGNRGQSHHLLCPLRQIIAKIVGTWELKRWMQTIRYTDGLLQPSSKKSAAEPTCSISGRGWLLTDGRHGSSSAPDDLKICVSKVKLLKFRRQSQDSVIYKEKESAEEVQKVLLKAALQSVFTRT